MDENKQEAIRLRRDDRMSLSEISSITGLSKSTLSTLLRNYPLTKEEQNKKQTEINKRTLAQRSSQIRRNTIVKDGLTPISENIPSYKRGLIGEAYSKYILLRNGFEIFEPSVLEPGCDVLVKGSSGKYYRCEIKSSSTNEVTTKRTKFKLHGGYTSEKYTEQEQIDLFICVLLNREEVFIIPAAEILESCGHISLGGEGKFTIYKNRFDLIE